MTVTVYPSRPVGSIRPPSSKSIAHRALFCAMNAEGEADLGPIDMSEDIRATMNVRAAFASDLRGGAIDCGRSASTLRFAVPHALTLGEKVTFAGSGGLMERPMGVYARLCARHGWEYVLAGDRLTVRGKMTPGEYELGDCDSSQFLSGMMMALGSLKAPSRILFGHMPSMPYARMTARVMAMFGQKALLGDGFAEVGGGYRGARISIEPDWSQAAVWLCMGAIGGDVECEGLDPESPQGDAVIARRLRMMGAGGSSMRFSEGPLEAMEFDCTHHPDLAPMAAACGCFSRGVTVIRNIHRLRIKESDRAEGITQIIRALGGLAEMRGDEIAVHPLRPEGGEADCLGDHRLAMMAAALGCFSRSSVTIKGAEAANKSYPDFWRHLASLGVRMEINDEA